MRAREIVMRALQLDKILASGEAADAADAALALSSLNAMVESWSLEPSAILVPRMQPLPLIPGISSYTIGPTGDLVTTRPADLLDASFVRFGDVDQPVRLVTIYDWNAIPVKDVGGWPFALYYDQAIPDGRIHLFPVPSQGGMVLHVADRDGFAQWPTLDTDIPMGPGYLRALQYNLAVEIADLFGRPVAPNVQRIANGAKRTLKRQNTIIPTATIDPTINGGWPYGYGPQV